uniref:Syntaxin 11 n=1 Tax=Neogobius melanostomus TaxID=47308 RepID=A0A8C6SUL2_9GOBI
QFHGCCFLQFKPSKKQEAELHEPVDETDIDDVLYSQEAVVFETPSAFEDVLKEAHSIRKELSVLRFDVERLTDSDSIARGIVQRGEDLYARIQALGQDSRRLQETEGPNRAVSRIAQTQYDTLTCAFHNVMNQYNKAEMIQRSMCCGRIKRHASIMGTEITDLQLDELVDKGGEGWAEFSQSLQTQGARSSRWALREIQGRHKELLELESRLKQVHDLFLQMAVLVEEQGGMLNNIEANVNRTEEYVERINVQLKKALKYKKKNPFLQCCPCLPCWRYNDNKTF